MTDTNHAPFQIDRLTPADAQKLEAYIRHLQSGDKLRPVTVIAPSNYAQLALRHTIGRSGNGFANVRFAGVNELAELLCAPLFANAERKPLKPVVRSAAVRQAALKAKPDGAFGGLHNHHGTHRSLRRTFDQLRHATPDALAELKAQGGLAAETAELYGEYLSITQGYYDNEDAAGQAAQAVRDGNAPGLRDIGFVIFFHVRNLTPAQIELAQALAEKGRCAMMFGRTGDADADGETDALANKMRDAFGEDAAHASECASANANANGSGSGGAPATNHISDNITGDNTGDNITAHAIGSISAANTHMLIAPDAHQEIRWVMRRIMRRADAGTPFHRIAILYRTAAPYGTLIHEELALADIPTAGPNATPLAASAVGRTLTGMLDMHKDDYARGDVMNWLTGGAVSTNLPSDKSAGKDKQKRRRFNPSRWDKISKRANVVRGEEQWASRLANFAAAERTGEWDAKEALKLAKFVSELIADTRPPKTRTWECYSQWATDLLKKYVYISDDNAAERKIYDQISRILTDMKSAGAVETQVDFATFRQALDEELQMSSGHHGAVGAGVFVAPIGQAAGMNFDVAHIVGMVEGAMPPAMPDDPLIPESARTAAGGSGAGLPLRQQKRNDERYDYLAALATTGECTMSYPIVELAGQRENHPSRWFLEAASQLEGRHIYSSTLSEVGGEKWMTRINSMEHSLSAAQNADHADKHDYNLERLHTTWKAGGAVEAHALASPDADEGLLAASLLLNKARNSRDFTAWDGNVSAHIGDITILPTDRPLSPTRMEDWAKCPFQYFLKYTLYLKVEDAPEDIYTIDSLNRGSLVHGILDDFIKAKIDGGAMPKPGEAWTDEDHDELQKTADKWFVEYEGKGVVGKPILWGIVQGEIRSDLTTFLAEDSKLRAKNRMTPTHTEASFGMPGEDWDAAKYELPDGTPIEFRGYIDRVDISEDEKQIFVMDYKTGNTRPFTNIAKDPVNNGKHLQHIIYGLAAQQHFGGDAEIKSAYWFTSSSGKFARIPSNYMDIKDDEVMQRFKEGMSTIANGIRQGIFPARPGNLSSRNRLVNNCVYCDFKKLCHSRRDVLWARKTEHKNNAQLEEYRALAEDAYEPGK